MGCHKNVATSKPKTLEEGVARLRTALISANPEIQSNLYSGVCYDIRYGYLAKASLALQSIASDPSLNEQQKNAVNDVGDLLKQTIESQQNNAQPAH
jgi:hypothetical protein